MILIYYILHLLKYFLLALMVAFIPGIGIVLMILFFLGGFIAAAYDAQKSVQKRKDRAIAARFEAALSAHDIKKDSHT